MTNKLKELFTGNPSTPFDKTQGKSLGVKDRERFFMAHAIAGYPSLSESEKICEALIKNGADILELQIPFSDPMADGPTIATACHAALEKENITVEKVLKLAKRLSRHGKPVVIMSYLNPVFRYGMERFIRDAKKHGVSGVILPDTPLDTPEGATLAVACKTEGVAFIPVVSPGTPRDRLEAYAKVAGGFVYCTSRQGITGAGGAFSTAISSFVKELREVFDLPIAIGFGITTRKDVQAAYRLADIAIAGSVFVAAIGKGAPARSVADTITQLLD